MKTFALKESVTAEEIRSFRNRHALSRVEFAGLVGVSLKTVEYWENKKEPITGPLALSLACLEMDPDLLEKLELPKQAFPLRLIYRKQDRICTVIDVDEMMQRIRIKNYARNIMDLAFGKNNSPSYEDYEEFLKERCFPETLDKRKLMLEELGIPFYDPMLIIEKTEGRMADDHFWIEVIRK